MTKQTISPTRIGLILLSIFGVLGVIALVIFIQNVGLDTAFSDIQNSILPKSVIAKKYCKKEILSLMKSPRSTVFDSIEVVDVADGTQRVSMTYDSDNSFGASIRSSQDCYVKFDGNTPTVNLYSDM